MVVTAQLSARDGEVDGSVKARRLVKGLEKMLERRQVTVRLLRAVW
jgi:hypothetical protein